MEEIYSPKCSQICSAKLQAQHVAFEVTELEENALELGCDVYGGHIKCNGPIPVLIEDVEGGASTVISCQAKCEPPNLVHESQPEVAERVGAQILEMIKEVFEFE